MRVRPSPAKQIIDLVKAYPGITRTELAAMLDRSYWSIRYWCDKLEKEGKIKAKFGLLKDLFAEWNTILLSLREFIIGRRLL